MSNRPPISWNAALRDLKGDRQTVRPEIREERLRTARGLYGSPAIALSAWRGLSAKRYVVGVRPISTTRFDEVGPAVVLAVKRDAHGIGSLVAVATTVSVHEPEQWVHAAEASGATELHVHLLAEGEAERDAVVADLTAPGADLLRAA